MTNRPPLSIVVPVHNEAAIADANLRSMVAAFGRWNAPFEILVCENGSGDGTFEIVDLLALECPAMRVVHLASANYGKALQLGIASARHDFVVIFNIDFWSAEFVERAVALVGSCDLVVGSKVMAGARDERPLARRLITRSFNLFLRLLFGFRGTDTHGLKALRRSALAPVAAGCVTDRSIFDTELVLRAARASLRIVEVPVDVRELRQPSYLSVFARAPEAVWNVLRLVWAIGVRPARGS